MESVSPCESRKGTIITVTELFYNTPARLKHLKSLYTELANITDYMNKLSLSHPDIRFSLKNNDSVILQTDGSGNLLKTIKSIYGLDVTKRMIKVEGENEDYEISGYISLPEVHRSSRNNMITIVNGRVVRNTDINRTINDAYHSYKPDNRYPITVLNIIVDPTVIDVNIHPTKMDIKFGRMNTLLELIEQMVKDVISKKELIPEVSLPPKVEKKQKIVQTLDLNRQTSFFEENNTNEYEEYQDEIILNDDFEVREDENYVKDLENEKDKLPELYPVGLVHGTYIICQNEKGMYMIDQHAAKERCNYEKFKKAMGMPSGNSIQMLFPLTIELSTNEFIILKENMEFLRSLNFDIMEFGINSIIVKSHPTWIPKGYENEAIKRIVDIIVNIEKNFTVEKFNESVATMMSCKLAIKANTNITMEEMEALINELRECDNPFNCPHGRPTMIFYSNYDIEKLFKRSGFDVIK
jgi:DNA mismatch repair protein MutL